MTQSCQTAADNEDFWLECLRECHLEGLVTGVWKECVVREGKKEKEGGNTDVGLEGNEE
jgi:hypothetical protein